MNNYFMYLKKYLLSQKIRVIVILICTIIQSGVSIIIPYIYKILIDDVFPKKQVYDFYCCILILFVGFISNFFFSTAKDYFTAVTSEMIAKNIKSDLIVQFSYSVQEDQKREEEEIVTWRTKELFRLMRKFHLRCLFH